MNLSNIFKNKELPENYEWELTIAQKILKTVNPICPKLINDGTAYQEGDIENREWCFKQLGAIPHVIETLRDERRIKEELERTALYDRCKLEEMANERERENAWKEHCEKMKLYDELEGAKKEIERLKKNIKELEKKLTEMEE
jgi:hypothetical protein